MSSQRGNTARTRPQKYKNKRAFKNDLHDKTNKIKLINSIQVGDVCLRCKDVIDWKIKYKKYKPLTQPKTCTKCSQKTVKKAYHVICTNCVQQFKVCAKCLQAKEIVPAPPDQREQLKLDAEMKQLLQSLPERKRRTFMRYMNKKQDASAEDSSQSNNKDDLMSKLHDLKLNASDDDDDDIDSDCPLSSDYGCDSDDYSDSEEEDSNLKKKIQS